LAEIRWVRFWLRGLTVVTVKLGLAAPGDALSAAPAAHTTVKLVNNTSHHAIFLIPLLLSNRLIDVLGV
jgi:hypothetical protein